MEEDGLGPSDDWDGVVGEGKAFPYAKGERAPGALSTVLPHRLGEEVEEAV